MALDIAQGMMFLHSRGYIHRDLKSHNLLVDDNLRIKVCDFGFARCVDKSEVMTVCGTDEWMAPEGLSLLFFLLLLFFFHFLIRR